MTDKPWEIWEADNMLVNPKRRHPDRPPCTPYINRDALVEWLQGQKKDEPHWSAPDAYVGGFNDCIDTILKKVSG